MKKIFNVLVFVLVFVSSASAQDKVEANVSASLVSGYIWRGTQLDDAAVQPALGVSYKGLSLSALGSYGITGKSDINREFDLVLAYSIGGFNVGITDYWLCNDDETKYFEYRNNETAHIFEANIGYDFGPLSLQWYTNFAGADGLTKKGKRAYTSYVEANVPFKLAGLDWTGTVGAVPYSAGNGFYEANSDGFAVTNVALKASKDIKITDSFSVPLFAQVIANPSYQKAYLVVGFTVAP